MIYGCRLLESEAAEVCSSPRFQVFCGGTSRGISNYTKTTPNQRSSFFLTPQERSTDNNLAWCVYFSSAFQTNSFSQLPATQSVGANTVEYSTHMESMITSSLTNTHTLSLEQLARDSRIHTQVLAHAIFDGNTHLHVKQQAKLVRILNRSTDTPRPTTAYIESVHDD